MNTVTRMNVYVPKPIVYFEHIEENTLRSRKATLKLTINMDTKVSADVALNVNVVYKNDGTFNPVFTYGVSLYGVSADGYPVIDHPCYIVKTVPELVQLLHSRRIPFPYGAYLGSCENISVIQYDELAYPVPILEPEIVLWSLDHARIVLDKATTEFVAILKANNVVIGPPPCIVEEPARPNDVVEPPKPTRGAETKVAAPAPLVVNNRWAAEPAVAAPKAASPKAAPKAASPKAAPKAAAPKTALPKAAPKSAAPKFVIGKNIPKKGATAGFAPNAFSPSLVKHPLEKDEWLKRMSETINAGHQPNDIAKKVDIIRMVLGNTADSLSDRHIDDTLDCILERLEFAAFAPAAESRAPVSESRAPVAESRAPDIHDDYAASDCFILVPGDTFDIFDMKCSDYREPESPLSPSDEFICFDSKFGCA
jgi:hypothetical protein